MKAAVQLADSLPTKKGTLGALVTIDCSSLEPPFHIADAFDMLVWSLIAERTIELEVHSVDTADDGTKHCYVCCSSNAQRIDEYRNRRRELDVLLHGPTVNQHAASPATVDRGLRETVTYRNALGFFPDLEIETRCVHRR